MNGARTRRLPGEPTPQRRPGAVLLVEDDASVRMAIERMLQAGGFDVIPADGAAAALDVLRSGKTRIALVLLDLNMSGIDGRAFRRIQLADDALAAVPTVVLTGAPLQDVDDAMLNAADYLLKPVGREHLLSVVAAYCRPADNV